MFSKGDKLKIALIGVDGAGKTTILNELQKDDNIKTIYMGFREFKLQRFITILSKFGKLGIIIQHFIVYIENLIRFIKAKILEKQGYKVLFDRYPLIDYQVASQGSYFFYKLFYKNFFPKPDKIILIIGKVDEIYQRKPELSKDEILEIQTKLQKLNDIDIVVENNSGYLFKTVEIIKKEIY